MYGVRRFLGGGLTSAAPSPPQQQQQPAPAPPPLQTTAPLAVSAKPTWPPSPTGTQPDSPLSSPKTTTVGLFLRKDKQKPPPFSNDADGDNSPGQSTRPTSNSSSVLSPTRSQTSTRQSSPATTPGVVNQSLPSSPGAGPSSPPIRPTMPNRKSLLSRKAVQQLDPTYKRTSELLNTRDELLMTLLASEAVVDSRDCIILSAEEVEELKKEHHVLTSRLVALKKKLSLETRIRDAAMSLSRVNAPNKRMSKQTQEQLAAANNKVDVAQKELWRVSERANEVNRKLLEHRAGVLGFSVRSLENKMAPPTDGIDSDGGYDTPNRNAQLSPTLSSQTSASTSSKVRFEGAHLFAGHADTVVPRARPTMTNIIALEEKLKVATENLNAANKRQAEMRQELSLLQLDKDQVETSMAMELQNAEETITSLEKELNKLDEYDARMQDLLQERSIWGRDKAALVEREKEVEMLERRLEVLEERSGEASEMEALLSRAREDLRRKDQEIEDMQAGMRGEEDRRIEEVQDALLDARTELDRCRQTLGQELDQVKREREQARQEIKVLEARVQDPSSTLPTVEYKGDVAKVMAILQPIWAVLPSPEARASRVGSRMRTGAPSSNQGSPKTGPTSLSDMDVRSLKTLYDNRASNPLSPNPGSFSIEAFAARVQALVQDDRALIERLIRFAQAHDLLKKNAERAQKLAQDSNSALETYQRQVTTLEERNMTMTAKQFALQEEVRQLQESVDRITTEKLDLEMQAADQAETCRQLTEANNSLSARTLTLADEAASASGGVRRQMEAQLSECKLSLRRAEEELESMRISEQSQRAALMDELNSMQTENNNLRGQLRAVKK